MAIIQTAVLVVFCVFVLFTFSCFSADSNGVGEKVPKCSNSTAKNTLMCLKQNLIKNYDTSMRPVSHHTNQTTVYMALFPMRVSMMKQTSVLYMSCWVQKSWVDELLKWDPRDYEDLKEITVKSSSIWQPDIIPVPTKGYNSMWAHSTTANIMWNGTVNTAGTVAYYTSCVNGIEKWPYDTSKCVLTLQSQAYKGPELNILIMDHKTSDMKHYQQKPGWTLASMSSARVTSESFESKYFIVNLEYTFVVKRVSALFTTAVVFPAFLLSISQLGFLCLDKECSLRLILCSMIAGLHCLFFNFSPDYIPSAGDKVPDVVKFYKYSLTLTVCGIIWTIFARNLCSRLTSPYWLYTSTTKIRNNRFLAILMPSDGNMGNSTALDAEDASSLVTQADRENSQWRNMAEFLDRIVFGICVFVYLCLYILYVP